MQAICFVRTMERTEHYTAFGAPCTAIISLNFGDDWLCTYALRNTNKGSNSDEDNLIR